MSLVDATIANLVEILERHEAAGEHKLPSELELSAQLGVSRATVRDALGRLEASGRVERKRGRGTLIVNQRSAAVRYPVNRITSFSSFLQASGVPHQMREFIIAAAPADEETREALRVNADSHVYEVRRVYAIRNEPAAYVCHLLPPAVGGQPLAVDQLSGDIVSFLERVHGLTVRVSSAITAEEATATLAEKLHMDVGRPLLVMYTRIRDSGGATVALGALAFKPTVVALGVEAIEHLTATTEDGLAIGWLGNHLEAATRERT